MALTMHDRYEARRRLNGQAAALTRPHRRSRHSVRLTPRGERLLVAGYTITALTLWGLFLLAVIGLAGWIETHP